MLKHIRMDMGDTMLAYMSKRCHSKRVTNLPQ